MDEALHLLNVAPGKIVLDATLGGAGHSQAIAEAITPGGTLIGMDRDTDALAEAETRLKPQREHLSIILLHSSFGNLDFAMETEARTKGVRLDGALFDLGVSSHQLDTARGFSFRRDEPLDMQMDATAGRSAAALIAEASEAELTRILTDYGEERWARRIAQNIVAQRAKQPIATTAQLAGIVERSIPRAAWPKDIHVATRTFQGIRIAVNDELGQLEAGLNAAFGRLRSGGRLVVISYHSLEDRIVKQAFAAWAGRTPSAPGSSPAAFLTPAAEPVALLITRKPVPPTPEEIVRNPRARSARLRAIEKL